jgi:hypothetical protein
MTATVAEPTVTENGAKRGRKPKCGHDMGNGLTCELNKDHEGKHDALELTEDDFTLVFVPAEKVQKVRTSTKAPDPMFRFAQERIEQVYKAWVEAGASDENLIYGQVTVKPELKAKIVNYLRRAASARKPTPVGLHWGESSFVKGGRVAIPFAVTERRKYEPKNEDK